MTVWAVNIVTNTNKYVETMAPIASNPTVITNTSVRVTNQFFSSAEVQKRITDALPKKASALAVPLTDGLHTTVQNQVQKILSSAFFQEGLEQRESARPSDVGEHPFGQELQDHQDAEEWQRRRSQHFLRR
jgi:hypothetical protein